jgi:hypothetical protein
MDENEATTYDDAAPEATGAATDTAPEPDGDESGSSPTAMAAYNLAQGIKDLCEQVRGDLSKGEHVKGRKTLNKILDGIESYVEDALAAGKMVEADLSDDDGDEAEPTEPEPVEPEDTEADDEGIVKGIPMTVRKALKRYSLQQIQKAQELESKELADASAKLTKALARLNRVERRTK